MPDYKEKLEKLGIKLRQIGPRLAASTTEQRNQALKEIALAMEKYKDRIFQANQQDLKAAGSANLAPPLLRRLEIKEKTFQYMKNRLLEASSLPDPLGKILYGQKQPSGLMVYRISVPIGNLAMIYESRPNVTTDAAAACIKSGNTVILRGGSESQASNRVLLECIGEGLETAGLPRECVSAMPDPGREAVSFLLGMSDYIDLLIPRGGRSLIESIKCESRIPVLKHYDGICHQYIDASADLEKALSVTVNSKCQRVEVCNALETLLIDSSILKKALPPLVEAFSKAAVELRLCPICHSLFPELKKAEESDWSTEYLDAILSIKAVKEIDEAIAHINCYGSMHTDGIITENLARARYFCEQVNSASVLVNASTRLSGGGDYGQGAVIGISTDKLQARGPVGPEQLTSYKWLVYGDGQIRH